MKRSFSEVYWDLMAKVRRNEGIAALTGLFMASCIALLCYPVGDLLLKQGIGVYMMVVIVEVLYLISLVFLVYILKIIFSGVFYDHEMKRKRNRSLADPKEGD